MRLLLINRVGVEKVCSLHPVFHHIWLSSTRKSEAEDALAILDARFEEGVIVEE
jgi:hypothetical protein